MLDITDNLSVIRRSLIRAPHQFMSPEDGLLPSRLLRTIKFKINTYKENPFYFKPCGTLVFCGSQGEGKTLSAVMYIQNILKSYPMCILCTNTKIKGRPINAYIDYTPYSDKELKQMYAMCINERQNNYYNSVIDELKEDFLDLKYPEFTMEDYIVKMLPLYPFDKTSDFEDFQIEVQYKLRDIFTDAEITTDKIIDGTFKNVTVQYSGLNSFKYINNNKCGVIFFVDEIHLELNSLESKNIPVEVMVEISQQRKQRKHIVGTSQRYNRLAKPLREQVKDIVACHNFFGAIQWNKLIDGDSTHEVNGELAYDVVSRQLFFHDPAMYKAYDTYAKMRRYNNEWQGRPQVIQLGGIVNE